MVKRAVPPSSSVVALLASLRQPCLHVIRTGRALEGRQVAGYAGRIGAGQCVVVVCVALRALQARVRPGQCEAGGVVIKRSSCPSRSVVALVAALRKIRLHVVRDGGGGLV